MNYSTTSFTNRLFNGIAKSVFVSMLLMAFTFSSHAQLAGSYTIGSGGDYTTWNEAVDSLVSLGVSGPVIMNVFDGNYTEQLTIPAITGASATNTITFQSNSLDSSLVNLLFLGNTTDEWVIRLNGASYINFKHLSITNTGTVDAQCFYFLGGASNDTISNCILTGTSSNPTNTDQALIFSSGSQDENNVIQNNLFIYGSYGVYLRGVSTSVLSASLLSGGIPFSWAKNENQVDVL